MTGGQRNEIYISKCYKDLCYFYLILQLIVGAMGVSVAGKLLVNSVNILILSSVCLFMKKKWLLLGHQSIKRELYLVSEYSSK